MSNFIPFDIVLIVVLAGFAFYGLFFGLIRSAGVAASIVLGLAAAGATYGRAYEWLAAYSFGYEKLEKIILFILIFIIASRLVMLVFQLIDKVFSALALLPFIGFINKILGAIFGIFFGALVVGIILNILGTLPVINSWLSSFSNNSRVAPYLSEIAAVALPFIPGIIVGAKEFIIDILVKFGLNF